MAPPDASDKRIFWSELLCPISVPGRELPLLVTPFAAPVDAARALGER